MLRIGWQTLELGVLLSLSGKITILTACVTSTPVEIGVSGLGCRIEDGLACP